VEARCVGAFAMSALVRITMGVMPQHSRVGMTRAMSQFGPVIHCHKPPYSGIPGEDFVNVRFAAQDAADRAYAALKSGQVYVDGFQVGVGPAPALKNNDGLAALSDIRRRSESPPRRFGRNRPRSPLRRSPPRRERERREERRRPSPPTANFPSRNDPKSPSPRRMAQEMHLSRHSRSRSRPQPRDPGRRFREERHDFFTGVRVKEKPLRSASPDPPGPVKNLIPVPNPFYRPNRSPSPELEDMNSNNNGYAPSNPYYVA